MELREDILKILADCRFHTYKEIQEELSKTEGFDKEKLDETLRQMIQKKVIWKVNGYLYQRNTIIRELSHEMYVLALRKVSDLMETMGVRRVDLFEGTENYEVAKAIIDIKKILKEVLSKEPDEMDEVFDIIK